jgi:hypothetical protein
LSPSEDVFFDINLQLPAPSPGSIFYLDELVLKLPFFSLSTENLSDAQFRIVALDMQHAPINLQVCTLQSQCPGKRINVSPQGLSADIVVIENENDSISGSFNVTRELKIISANAPVDASVNLHSVSEANEPVILTTVTSGSYVKAQANFLKCESHRFLQRSQY